jgi:hypothetical protein
LVIVDEQRLVPGIERIKDFTQRAQRKIPTQRSPGKRAWFPFAGFAFLNLCALCVKNCFALICLSLMTMLID